MWHTLNTFFFSQPRQKRVCAMIGFFLIVIVLAGCSGTSTASTNSGGVAVAPQSGSNNSSSAQPHANSAQGNTAAQYGPQYLVKSLQVTLSTQDTRQSASDLQQWIQVTDAQATSNGLNYSLVNENQYNVTLTFLVDVSHYAQVESYLRDYAKEKGNQLLSLQETVQDVTNDFVDTQARLTNLRAEQQRLLSFMNQTQNVNDAVNIETQLSQVEGQIEDIEAHLNSLKGQTTYYNVTINLQPADSTPPPTEPDQWSISSIWQGAWSMVVGIWQVLVSLLVWLAALSIYIIPILIIVWLVRWWRTRTVHGVPLHSTGEAAEPK